METKVKLFVVEYHYEAELLRNIYRGRLYIYAESRDDILNYLSAQGCTPVSIREVTAFNLTELAQVERARKVAEAEENIKVIEAELQAAREKLKELQA